MLEGTDNSSQPNPAVHFHDTSKPNIEWPKFSSGVCTNASAAQLELECNHSKVSEALTTSKMNLKYLAVRSPCLPLTVYRKHSPSPKE